MLLFYSFSNCFLVNVLCKLLATNLSWLLTNYYNCFLSESNLTRATHVAEQLKIVMVECLQRAIEKLVRITPVCFVG